MIIRDEPNEVYHANKAISSSQAKLALKSLQLFKDNEDGLIERKESPAMAFGSAVHCAILESDEYAKRYAVKPADFNGRTKEGKAMAAQWEKDGVIMLDAKDQQRIDLIVERMPAVIGDIFNECETELTYRTDDAQARFDALHKILPRAYDLKSVASLDRAERQIHELGYWFSAGWYNMLYDMEHGRSLQLWAWIFCETNPPFHWKIVKMLPMQLQDATHVARMVYGLILRARKTGKWAEDYELTSDWAPKPWEAPEIMK